MWEYASAVAISSPDSREPSTTRHDRSAGADEGHVELATSRIQKTRSEKIGRRHNDAGSLRANTMLTPHTQATANEPSVSNQCSRRAALSGALGSALKLVAAGWALGGPLGSLAACAPDHAIHKAIATQQAPTPSPAPLHPITPATAPALTPIATLQPSNGYLRAAAVAPEGRILATGGRTDIQLWDASTGALRNSLTGHTEQIYDLAWSPASGRLASASFDGTVRVWDVERCVAQQTLDAGPTASVFSVAWAPDGRQLASGLLDGRVLLWDVATATQRRVLSRPAGHSQGGRYPFAAWGSPGRRMGVTWSPHAMTICCWCGTRPLATAGQYRRPTASPTRSPGRPMGGSSPDR
jgi:hypothetical protein